MWFKKKKEEKSIQVDGTFVKEDATGYLIERGNAVGIPMTVHSRFGMLGGYVRETRIYFRRGSEPICDEIVESSSGVRRFFRQLEVNAEGEPIGYEKVKENITGTIEDIATKKQVDEMVLAKKKPGRKPKAKK